MIIMNEEYYNSLALEYFCNIRTFSFPYDYCYQSLSCNNFANNTGPKNIAMPLLKRGPSISMRLLKMNSNYLHVLTQNKLQVFPCTYTVSINVNGH